MPDQASHLRQLVREAVAQHGELAPGAPLIAVTGASAGVGATTVACGVARELARLGQRVVLVDANLMRPAVAERCGVRADVTLADVLGGRRRAIEALVQVDGLRLLAGVPVRHAVQLDKTSLSHLLSELAALGRQCDMVILDVGAGMSPWTDRVWHAASQALVIATPDDAALVDAYTTVKLAQRQSVDGKARLVVNRALNEAAARQAGDRFEATCRRFLAITPQAAVVLPAFAPRGASDASAEGKAPFASAMHALAGDLTGSLAVRGQLSVAGEHVSQMGLNRKRMDSLSLVTDHGPLTTDH